MAPVTRPHPAAILRPVYEDFRPVTERIEDDESNSLLLIYLPGFLKEQIRVQIEGRNTLRINGQRLVADNKWSRFQEGYPLPEDCNLTGIRAKFQEGILTVTIPRKKEAEDASKTAPKPIEKDAPEPAQKTQEKVSDDSTALSEKTPSVSELARGRVLEKVSDTPPAPDHAAAASSLDSGLRSYKQVVRKVLNLNEERQFLENMGAAALVVVAFGAYLSYSKPEEAT